jgi:hypothetical protein
MSTWQKKPPTWQKDLIYLKKKPFLLSLLNCTYIQDMININIIANNNRLFIITSVYVVVYRFNREVVGKIVNNSDSGNTQRYN